MHDTLLTVRQELAKVIPGLRPWEVISVEQAMDQISYGGEWYRKPLGTYTTGPPYIREWNRNVRVSFLLIISCGFRQFVCILVRKIDSNIFYYYYYYAEIV